MPMYEDVPKIADASVANVVGTTTVQVVPAPAGTRRIRVVGWSIGVTRTATGGVDAGLRSATSLTVIARAHGLTVAGTSMADYVAPGPGLPIEAGEALQLFTTSTAATGSTNAIVYFYYDDET